MKMIRISGQIITDAWSGYFSEKEAFWPKLFYLALKKADGEDVELSINSQGGLVSGAWEIINMMRDYPGKISTVISGSAASSAGLIWAYGDERWYYPTSELMLHRCSVVVAGNSTDLLELADVLDKTDKATASRLSALSQIKEEELLKKMETDWTLIGDEIALFGAQKREGKIKKEKAARKKRTVTAFESAKNLKVALDKRDKKEEEGGIEVEENAIKAAEPGVADKNVSAVKNAVTAERERVIGIFKVAGGHTKAAEDAVASGQSLGEFAIAQLERERAASVTAPPVSGVAAKPDAVAESLQKMDDEMAQFIAKKRGVE